MAETRFPKNKKESSWLKRLPFLLFLLTISLIVSARFMNAELPVVATLNGVPTGYLPQELPLSPDDLRVLPDTGYFGKLAARSEERLPGYQHDLQNLPKLTSGATVDVILQAHSSRE